MLHNSKRALLCFQRLCAVLGLLCFSNTAWAITVSPSPSSDGSYTVSWPAWGATGCTYNYYEQFVTFSCYTLEELAPGGSWMAVGLPDSSTSWAVTGKTPGIYEYRLQYAYGDIWYGNQYVIDGPVSVEVLAGFPPSPLPPEQIPPDLENPPFRCSVVNTDYYSGQPADVSLSLWYWDTFWNFVYPVVVPGPLHHGTDDPSCMLFGPSPDSWVMSPMRLEFAPGQPITIPGTDYWAVRSFLTRHYIAWWEITGSICYWQYPFPCEVAGAVLALGIDPINWKWIGRWAVHSALIVPY